MKILPEHFAFTGTRVMLNPESPHYNEYKDTVKKETGYVINQNATKEGLRYLLTKELHRIPDWIVRVRFDCGVEANIAINRLLLIENVFKDVHTYILNNGGEVSIIEEGGVKELDRLIIKDGLRVTNVLLYDKAYRNKHIADAYEFLSNNEYLSNDSKLTF